MKKIKLTSIFLSAAFCAAVISGCKGSEHSPVVENDNSINNESSFSISSDDVSDLSSTATSSNTAASSSAAASSSTTASSSTATSSSTALYENSSSENESAQPPQSVETSSKQNTSSESEAQTPTTVHTHNYTSKTVSASCNEKGFTTYTCSCGDQYVSDYVEALGHNYAKNVVKPTCENDGYTEYTCSRCNDRYTDNKTPALGHSWGEWKTVKEATASSEGEQRSKCSNCGQTKSESIPKLKADANSYTYRVVEIVNEERAKAGLSELVIDNTLMDYAQLRSREIVDKFAHERPGGANPLNYVMKLDGISYSGENIAYGQSSPESVMTSWMNSQGHHDNIMSSKFTKIGVGCYEYNGRLYWTQIFAG